MRLDRRAYFRVHTPPTPPSPPSRRVSDHVMPGHIWPICCGIVTSYRVVTTNPPACAALMSQPRRRGNGDIVRRPGRAQAGGRPVDP